MNFLKFQAKKWIGAILIAALAATLMVPLGACTAIQERIIQEGIKRELEDIKQLKNESVNEMIRNAGSAEGFDLIGIGAEAFLLTWFSDFDYHIEKVSVEGDTATASISLTCKTGESFFNALGESISRFVSDKTPTDERSTKEVFGTLFLEAIKDAPTETVSINLPLEKKNGVWAPSDNYTDELEVALLGNAESSEGLLYMLVFLHFEPLKRLDDEAMDILLKETGSSSDFAAIGVSEEDFFKTWLAGFDYTIDSVAVESESTATATVTITCKQLNDAESILDSKVSNFVKSGSARHMNSEEIDKAVGGLLVEALNETTPKTTTLTLPFIKTSTAWEIDPANDSIKKALLGE